MRRRAANRQCGTSPWQDGAVIDWRALLAAEDGVEGRPAASESDITAAEAGLGVALPGELRELYAASDGVFDRAGQWLVVWPLVEVVNRNRMAWTQEPVLRRGLIGFGDDGTGAAFCVAANGSRGVFVWNAIDVTGVRLADTIAAFWIGWSNGSITT
jgi:hypothetical protein